MNVSNCATYLNDLVDYGENNYIKAMKVIDRPFMEAVLEADHCLTTLLDEMNTLKRTRNQSNVVAQDEVLMLKQAVLRFDKIRQMVLAKQKRNAAEMQNKRENWMKTLPLVQVGAKGLNRGKGKNKGKKGKVFVLGRERCVVRRGHQQLVQVKGVLVPLGKAREMECVLAKP